MQTLRLLSAGNFRSGEEMAQLLGVSRASVFNALHALDNTGLEIFRVRGRGYRLAEPLAFLDRAQVERELGNDARRFAIQIFDELDSTNTLLLQHAAAGAPSRSVIAAEWQRQGRGRRGRPWHAAIGAALTFSMLWRFPQGPAALAGLSLAVGVALVRALNAIGARVQLKWPNDVLHAKAKLAGILIEITGDMLGPSVAVIGIGINCRLPDLVRERIDQPASDLATATGAIPDRNRLLALVVLELEGVLQQFERSAFPPLRAEWESHHAHQGKPVELLHANGRSSAGIARGLADDGSLLLDTADGLCAFHSGEVSLRERSGG
jgi:BirA family biotin operon repressor/biotin-[acetyl-CoA-carboxylase] ligase